MPFKFWKGKKKASADDWDIQIGAPVKQELQEVAVAGQFRASPHQFIQSHPCTLSAELYETEDAFNEAPFGSTGQYVKFLDSNTHTLAPKLVQDGAFPTAYKIIATSSTDSPRTTFLPYRDDHLTAIQIHSQAKLFLTGPLSGCHVYIARGKGGEPYVFHVNSNETKGAKLAQNIAVKENMATDAVKHLSGYAITEKVIRGQYAAPAFVYGIRMVTGWAFYVHDFPGQKKTLTWRTRSLTAL